MTAQVFSGALAAPPPQHAPKLPAQQAIPPEAEQLSGPYGPRFVGYGPAPRPKLLQRIAPFAIGATGGLACLAAAAATGRLSF